MLHVLQVSFLLLLLPEPPHHGPLPLPPGQALPARGMTASCLALPSGAGAVAQVEQGGQQDGGDKLHYWCSVSFVGRFSVGPGEVTQ